MDKETTVKPWRERMKTLSFRSDREREIYEALNEIAEGDKELEQQILEWERTPDMDWAGAWVYEGMYW